MQYLNPGYWWRLLNGLIWPAPVQRLPDVAVGDDALQLIAGLMAISQAEIDAALAEAANEVVLDLGFCSRRDHLVIKLGASQGEEYGCIFMKFELWVEEDQVLEALRLASALRGEGHRDQPSHTCRLIRATGTVGREVSLILSLAQCQTVMAERLLDELRRFRADPYVQKQTTLWRSKSTVPRQ